MRDHPPPDPIPLELPGDPKGNLEALRDRLVAEIARSEGSAVASLAKQLTDVLKALDALPSGKEESAVDDLSKRRAARRKAAAPKPAAKGVERGAGGGRARS